MANDNLGRFDKGHPKEIRCARKSIKNMPCDVDFYTIAHFDLTGSTKNMKKNPKDTITKMITHNRICSAIIEKNGGTVVKELGDAVLATYLNIHRACQCALTVIYNFQKYGCGIRTKAAITAGTIEKIKTRKEMDVYGIPVNLCNRMSKLASEFMRNRVKIQS